MLIPADGPFRTSPKQPGGTELVPTLMVEDDCGLWVSSCFEIDTYPLCPLRQAIRFCAIRTMRLRRMSRSVRPLR
jgi:hypothetical protein